MKYGNDKTAEMVKYLQNGNTRVDSCILAGISYETFSQWMKRYPEFQEAIKKAETQCKSRNIHLVQKAALTTWQAACWWLERRYPQEFALARYELNKDIDEIPMKMAERAHELLNKLEGKKENASEPVHP